jgi:hypothetical protein
MSRIARFFRSVVANPMELLYIPEHVGMRREYRPR